MHGARPLKYANSAYEAIRRELGCTRGPAALRIAHASVGPVPPCALGPPFIGDIGVSKGASWARPRPQHRYRDLPEIDFFTGSTSIDTRFKKVTLPGLEPSTKD